MQRSNPHHYFIFNIVTIFILFHLNQLHSELYERITKLKKESLLLIETKLFFKNNNDDNKNNNKNILMNELAAAAAWIQLWGVKGEE